MDGKNCYEAGSLNLQPHDIVQWQTICYQFKRSNSPKVEILFSVQKKKKQENPSRYYKLGWRDGSVLKSTGCSSGGPEFNSQQRYIVAHNHL